MLKARDIRFSEIGCQMHWANLILGIEKCGFKIFSGVIQTRANLQTKSQRPTYDFSAQVDGLKIAEAVDSQLALLKNTVTGVAQLNISGRGASLNPEQAIANLQMTGNLKVTQAELTTIDVMKMVADAMSQTIRKMSDQVPALKGKAVGTLPTGRSRYESITSDFSVSGGQFVSPNFFAKAEPHSGIDLKGNTAVGIRDYSLNTSWDVIDTYNLTHLRDLSVEEAGIRVEHVLAEGDAPVHFMIHVGCTLMAPCYSYTEVPIALGRIALKNISVAVAGRARQEVRKQADSLIRQVAPPSLQDRLKGLFQ
jgi:hypothetical protein